MADQAYEGNAHMIWHPIDTPPDKNTVSIFFFESGHIAIGLFLHIPENPGADIFFTMGADGWINWGEAARDEFMILDPTKSIYVSGESVFHDEDVRGITHWMPLPEPPEVM